MKKFRIALTLSLIAYFAVNSHAQIPNAGFENWTTFGTYMEPDLWGTSCAAPVPYHAATRDTAHFPAAVGSYSLRLENNPAILPNNNAKGFAITGYQFNIKPAFPISGHPTSLTGYYQYLPQGDSLWMVVVLFQGGVPVSQGILISDASAPAWTPLLIPLSGYATADSATIILSAFIADGPTKVPHGNSVLRVDNLNFDSLILSQALPPDPASAVTVSPNPFSGQIEVEAANPAPMHLTLSSLHGQVLMETLFTGCTSLSTESLPPGMYVYEVRTDRHTVKQGKLIKY